ncbi:MAG TPA: hypothetical protein VH183_08220 [Burkholderiaceae bacterium]|jgi:hypothetical protein|nr:hypothetical protein [Burkholderiaceae bacterium]
MNVALSAIVVFFIAAPGFVFRSRYRRIERTSLDYAPFGEAVVLGVVFAAVLHVIWLLVARLFGWAPSLRDLLLLVGTDGPAQAEAIQRVAAHQYPVLLYFLSILLAPFVLAPAIRRVAESQGWHLPDSRLYRIFGINAPWYYLLRVQSAQRGADALVAAVVNFGGRCYVVRGFVADFFVKPNGELDRIVLEFADRRPLEADKDLPGSSLSERYYQIDGDSFVLRYSEAITLNVQYVEFGADEQTDAAASADVRSQARTVS